MAYKKLQTMVQESNHYHIRITTQNTKVLIFYVNIQALNLAQVLHTISEQTINMLKQGFASDRASMNEQTQNH